MTLFELESPQRYLPRLRLGAKLSRALAWPGALVLEYISAFPRTNQLTTTPPGCPILASFRASTSTFLTPHLSLLPTIQPVFLPSPVCPPAC